MTNNTTLTTREHDVVVSENNVSIVRVVHGASDEDVTLLTIRFRESGGETLSAIVVMLANQAFRDQDGDVTSASVVAGVIWHLPRHGTCALELVRRDSAYPQVVRVSFPGTDFTLVESVE